MNFTVALAVLVVAIGTGARQEPAKKAPSQLKSAVALGKATYLQYCASCHGPDARGTGPTAPALKTPPADLTGLAKTHGGKFPDEYVGGILRFGKPLAAHGSRDMPVWGTVLSRRENGDQAAMDRRIRNLLEYLATLQEKES